MGAAVILQNHRGLRIDAGHSWIADCSHPVRRAKHEERKRQRIDPEIEQRATALWKLSTGAVDILIAPVEANELFLEMPSAIMDALERDGFQFYRRSATLARFVCRFDLTDQPEFDRWRWVDYWTPVREVVYFKRRVYARALHELGKLLAPDGLPPYPDWWQEIDIPSVRVAAR